MQILKLLLKEVRSLILKQPRVARTQKEKRGLQQMEPS
jgi:hypothetical protein